jgi:S1-C subfamily serine protease
MRHITLTLVFASLMAAPVAAGQASIPQPGKAPKHPVPEAVKLQKERNASGRCGRPPIPVKTVEWAMKVTEVAPDGPAAKADLRVGDIIYNVDGVRMQTPRDLDTAIEAATGPIEIEIISPENNNKIDKFTVTPAEGKFGFTAARAVVK